MSISYSGIIGNKDGRGAVPSVENWNTNNNILKDPPKSIMTRRIDKVNQDGSLNEMLYHSGDRFAENINLYARGVNPMVSVEYGNSQNGSNAKLPYRIMNAGAFRPPQLRQEQLLPLSRQPRLTTQVLSNKEFKDYSKSAVCDQQPTCYRQINKEIPKGYVTPTKTFKIQRPVKEHFEIKYVIENPIHSDVYTNKQSRTNIQLENREPQRGIKDVNQYTYSSKIRGGEVQNYIHDDMILERNVPNFNTDTNKSSILKHNLYSDNDMVLDKNLPEYSAISNKNNNIYTNIGLDGEIVLDKNIPEYNISTNLRDNKKHVVINPENEYNTKNSVHYTMSSSLNNTKSNNGMVMNRQFNLPQSLNIGGMEGRTGIPQNERNINYNQNYQTSKTRIAENIRNSRN